MPSQLLMPYLMFFCVFRFFTFPLLPVAGFYHVSG